MVAGSFIRKQSPASAPLDPVFGRSSLVSLIDEFWSLIWRLCFQWKLFTQTLRGYPTWVVAVYQLCVRTGSESSIKVAWILQLASNGYIGSIDCKSIEISWIFSILVKSHNAVHPIKLDLADLHISIKHNTLYTR